jgi:hypothetical protein
MFSKSLQAEINVDAAMYSTFHPFGGLWLRCELANFNAEKYQQISASGSRMVPNCPVTVKEITPSEKA